MGEGGDSGAIRTHDPQLRRLLLYPAELRNPVGFSAGANIEKMPYAGIVSRGGRAGREGEMKTGSIFDKERDIRTKRQS